MMHAFITVVAPIPLGRVADAERQIGAMGNPAAADIVSKLDVLRGDRGMHFASMHAIRSQDGERGWLVLEFSADGSEEEALIRIVDAIGERLRPVFTLATDWSDGGDLAAYLLKHKVTPGCGWFAYPGVVFSGTPGMTVGRIRNEARLAARVTEIVGLLEGPMTALQWVQEVRRRLKPDNNGGARNRDNFAEALEPAEADPPYVEPSKPTVIGLLACSFIRTYLWPAGVVIVFGALLEGFLHARGMPLSWPAVWSFACGAGWGALAAFALTVAVVAALAGTAYALLRGQEERDWVDDRAPDRKTVAEIFDRENRGAQNHMVSVTRRKPGVVRWFTSRLVFWAIGVFASKVYRPGFLSDIGTIHFARWVTVPGSRDVLFFSNYDASWESYLEDFITRAHAGLTGVWSNSIGFPKSENLIQRGATDGERFKRYARRSMVPTRFWYSAYPSLTTTGIRANAEIRRGLSGVMTEDEAQRWLALFGSAARPASKLVSDEIQSLVFGGLGFMKFGTCLFFRLPDQVCERADLAAHGLPARRLQRRPPARRGSRHHTCARRRRLGPSGIAEGRTVHLSVRVP